MSYSRKVKMIPSPGTSLPGGVIFEEVVENGTVKYAVKYPKSGEVKVQPFYRLGEGVVYQPIDPCPWPLPPPPLDYVDAESLWREIYKFIHEHLDLEDDRLYDIMTAWVLHTWVVERVDSTPYLHFIGPSNSGKTRALNTLSVLCYRPLLSPSVSAASIYRALEAFRPTFLLDEFELYQRLLDVKAEVISVLNAGYKRGQVVIRTDKVVDGTPVLRGFNVFGPKAIASIEPLPRTLHGRVITFTMTRAIRKVRRLIDKDWAARIRGKLLKYRFDHVGEPPQMDNPIDLPDGRLIELYAPLIECAPSPDIRERILSYAKTQYSRSIQEEKETVEAEVYLTIIDLLKEKPAAYIYQQILRDRINAYRTKDQQMSKQKLSAVLRRLNLQSVSDPSKRTRLMTVEIDVNVLERRKIRYVDPDEMGEVDELFTTLRKKMTELVEEFKKKEE